MKKNKSITGLTLLVLFLIWVGVVYFTSIDCNSFGCLVRIFPVLPWFPLLGRFYALLNLENSSLAGHVIYMVSIIINAAILYVIGADIEKLIRKKLQSRGKNTSQK